MTRALLPALVPALLAVVLVVPAAAAQPRPGLDNPDASTPTTLFFHLIDFQDFPINTQQPDDNWTESTSIGFTGTTSCLPNGTPGADLSQAYHTYYGYSSPSYVEYLFEEQGSVRVHPERGISYDARLDPAAPFMVHWYVAAKLPGADLEPTRGVPVAVPNLVVEATMRAGVSITVDDAGYNTGPTIAHGRSRPATLVADQAVGPDGGPAPDVRPLGQVDGRWLFEVTVPMTLEQDVIPRATGYNVRIDMYVDNPACTAPTGTGDGAGALMPDTIQVHTSKDFRPRMQLSVLNPIRAEYLHPQFVGDDLVVHAALNSVWGNYDVAEVSPYTPQVTPDDIRLTIDGPSEARSLARVAFVMRSHDHYMHQEAVDAAWVWPYKVDQAKDGVYTVTLEFRNDQQTATARAVGSFEVGRNVATGCGAVQEASQQASEECVETAARPSSGANGAPAPGVAVALAGLASAGLAVRRRR